MGKLPTSTGDRRISGTHQPRISAFGDASGGEHFEDDLEGPQNLDHVGTMGTVDADCIYQGTIGCTPNSVPITYRAYIGILGDNNP